MSNVAALSIDLTLPLEPFTLSFQGNLNSRVTGLFGPSGSGKTSLVETIAGLRRDASGRITFGENVWQDSDQGIFVPPEHRGIGFVPQGGLLFPHLTVRQNLLFGNKRAPKGTDLFDQVIEILNLAHLLDRKPVSLSGGERQRVAAGRAVCSGPQVLIMDEPLSSLDATLRYKTLAFFIRLVEDLNLNMIWVSHDPIEVQAICDWLFAIDHGNITKHGKPTDVLTDPRGGAAFEFSGFQNVLRCQIVQSTESKTMVRVTGVNNELTLTVTGPGKHSVPRERAIVTIPARSILIATQNPSHVSAGNIIDGTIRKIETQSAAVLLVHVQLDDQSNSTPLVVELTTVARDRLGLEVGQSVYLLIKSTACVVQTMNNTWGDSRTN